MVIPYLLLDASPLDKKVNFLELMLAQIANYCPIISRSTLVKNSTSLEYILQTIRQHFGFQATGEQFVYFSDIHLAADERPEDLYQRLMAFVEDSLLHGNGLTHHGEHGTEDEELTPTLEIVVVLTWLRLIHPSLPRLVKQRYGTELRSCTLASIKPEISQALSSLLEEIRASDDAKILHAAVADDFVAPDRVAGVTQRPAPDSPARTRSVPYATRQERGATWQWLHLHIQVPGPSQSPTAVRRAFALRAPTPSKTVWPGEFLEVQLPDDAPPDSEYALEPRTDAPSLRNLKPSQLWPQPGVISSVVQAIRMPNLSTEPRTLKRHEHFCRVTPVFEPKEESPTSQPPTQRLLPPSHASHSASVQVLPRPHSL